MPKHGNVGTPTLYYFKRSDAHNPVVFTGDLKINEVVRFANDNYEGKEFKLNHVEFDEEKMDAALESEQADL